MGKVGKHTHSLSIVVFLCVLVGITVLSAGISASGFDGSAGVNESVYDSDGSLVVNLVPEEGDLERNVRNPLDQSTTFQLTISNPDDNDERLTGFLYAGYEDTSDSVTMTVAGEPPDARYQRIHGRFLEFDLAPGGSRIYPMTVYGNSSAGAHTLNATAIYLERSELQRDPDNSTIEIWDECTLYCQILRVYSNTVKWFGENFDRIVTVLSLLIALLSFFGYARVRYALKSLKESE